MSSNVLNAIVGGSYIIMIIAFSVFVSWMTIQKRKKLDAMQRNVYAKITSGIQLTAKDIVNIGKSFDLTAFQSRKVIYKVFGEADNKESFQNVKDLVLEIENEEPFDDMPDEVKPSLIRLSKLVDEAGGDSDKYLLSPIIGTLSKYVDQKSDQEKLKKQTNRAYALTIVSFVVGAISFYFTLTSPNAEDIALEVRAMEKSQATITDNSDSASGSGY